MYKIDIANQQSLLDVDEMLLRRIAERTLSAEQTAAADISLALVDDATIHALNNRHLGHDYPTDVLSFLFESDRTDEPGSAGRQIDGEVIISVETAVNRAAELEHSSQAELALYLVHGLLHLLGYDDSNETERRSMRSQEREILHRCELSAGVDW